MTYPFEGPGIEAPWQIRKPDEKLLRQIGEHNLKSEILRGVDPDVLSDIGYPDRDKPLVPGPALDTSEPVQPEFSPRQRYLKRSLEYGQARERMKDKAAEKMIIAKRV